MRANLIFSLLSFAGSIVLAILATTIPQYEGCFWVAAAFCVVAAIGVWASPRFLLDSGLSLKVAVQPAPDAVVSSGADKTSDNQPVSNSDRDVWLSDAMWWAFLRTWDVPPDGMVSLNAGESENQRFAMLVIDTFRQLAFEGKLPVWGKRKDSSILEAIPCDFWQRNHIDHILVLSADDPEAVKAQAEKFWEIPDTSGDWHHFMTSKAVVEQLYPRQQ